MLVGIVEYFIQGKSKPIGRKHVIARCDRNGEKSHGFDRKVKKRDLCGRDAIGSGADIYLVSKREKGRKNCRKGEGPGR